MIIVGYLYIYVALAGLSGLDLQDTPDIANEPRTKSCGVVALYQFLRLEMCEVDIGSIIKALPSPPPTGDSLEDLRRVAGESGKTLQGVIWRDEIHSPPRPMLAYVRRGTHGHFLVVRPVGHTGRLVQVLDGFNPPFVIDAEQLLKNEQWTGIGLADLSVERNRGLVYGCWLIIGILILGFLTVRLGTKNGRKFKLRIRIFHIR